MKTAPRLLIAGACLWLIGLVTTAAEGQRDEWRTRMMPVLPRSYVCSFIPGPIQVDGILDEAAWTNAPWTEDFVDIQGFSHPKPAFRTRAKLAWDKDYLYVAAELEEPHVWATLTNHDAVIFHDPDFEVFLDPDGDTHNYYEFEINALNTGWDLRLTKPYQDEGKALNDWEIAELKTAVKVHGTINNPADRDTGWTVELALPWKALGEYARHPGPPIEGEVWRINFSRVEWQISNQAGKYQKIPNKPEDNWVWSPQGVIDMHRPEKWGILKFTTESRVREAGPPSLPAKPAHDLAMEIYYAQRDFYKLNSRWARNLIELGWKTDALPQGMEAPKLELTPAGYSCSVSCQTQEGRKTWRVRQDRLLTVE